MSGRLVLVRHGQSHGNVDRRLDTRPPGAALTDLGRDQARAFARDLPQPAGMIAHSVALRAAQTAEAISGELGLDTHEVEGIHEVQVGDLEDRNDDDAIASFETVYQRWHEGDLDVPMPGGETGNEVLDRYVPVLTQLRMRYLDDDAWHGDIVVVSHGAAIRLVSAVLAGVAGAVLVGCVGVGIGVSIAKNLIGWTADGDMSDRSDGSRSGASSPVRAPARTARSSRPQAMPK